MTKAKTPEGPMAIVYQKLLALRLKVESGELSQAEYERIKEVEFAKL